MPDILQGSLGDDLPPAAPISGTRLATVARRQQRSIWPDSAAWKGLAIGRGWEKEEAIRPHRLALLGAVSTGHFLRRAMGSNA